MFLKTYKFRWCSQQKGLPRAFEFIPGMLFLLLLQFFFCLHLQQKVSKSTNLTFSNVQSLASPKWRTTDGLERLMLETCRVETWIQSRNTRWLNQRPQQSPSKKTSHHFGPPGPYALGGGGQGSLAIDTRQESKEREVTFERRFFSPLRTKHKNRQRKKAIKGAEVEQDVSGVKSMLDVLLTIILQFMKINRGMRSTVAIVGVSPNFMSFFWCEFAKGKKHFKSWQLFLA